MTGFARNIVIASQALADAVEKEMMLEDNRHTVKLAAITRIMNSGDNTLTGKPHSFSSAEALVHADVDYAAHLEQLRIAARERIIARGKYDAAVAAAELQEILP